MAPEQLRGETVSRLTDTYSPRPSCSVELLTGERLFVGKSQAETIHKSLVARVQPPSLFAPELGTKLDDIVRKALSRETTRAALPDGARAGARHRGMHVPAIRASEVGAWVERIGGEELAARAKVLADIERDDHEDARVTLHDAQPATSPNAVIEIELPLGVATIGPSSETPEPRQSQRTALLDRHRSFGVLALLVVAAFVALPRPESSNVHAAEATVTADTIPSKGIPAMPAALPAPPATATSASPAALQLLSDRDRRPAVGPLYRPSLRTTPPRRQARDRLGLPFLRGRRVTRRERRAAIPRTRSTRRVGRSSSRSACDKIPAPIFGLRILARRVT